MSGHPDLPRPVVLASFFERLETIGAVLGAALSNARVSAEMVFRGPSEQKVHLDVSGSRVRVLVDDNAHKGHTSLAVDSDVMHEVLLGRLHGAIAVGRRQMLLRGSISDLAHLIPLFDISPALYREHLADLGVDGLGRRTGPTVTKELIMQSEAREESVLERPLSGVERILFAGLNHSAYLLGYLMGAIRYRLFENLSLFDLLAAMSRGLDAATPREKK